MVPAGTQEAMAERAEPGRREEPWHRADVVCGGFPCQDISVAGDGAGITGVRSSLWRWLCGAIRLVRPRYAIVENVAALLGRGMGTVCGDLAESGYDAEWDCIPASAVGAPHQRDRIWIVAYPEGGGKPDQPRIFNSEALLGSIVGAGGGNKPRGTAAGVQEPGGAAAGLESDVADSDQPGLALGELQPGVRREAQRGDEGQDAGLGGEVSDSNREPLERSSEPRSERHHWSVEPDVGRVADGIPSRVDRLRALGNAVVPQIPEIIGRAIMKAECSRPQSHEGADL
jgi:DNA (cytosine-5)-methyltransferase 1